MTEITGLVSKIQKYSTKDGPGIRTTAFLIGCNLRCRWCANPEAMYPGNKIMYHASRCHKCGTCVACAQNHSIQLMKDGCIINREQCTNLNDMPEICNYDAYEAIGMTMTPDELFKKLIRDKVFYKTSGGGVTFSGGEACMQNEFLYETIKLLKKEEIHVALDTAGLWNFEKLKPILESCDLVLYDIKAFNNEVHKKCTGVDNQRILENAKNIARIRKPMFIRLIVVPGMNDDFEDVKNRLLFIKQLGDAVKQVDLLKYHKLGIGKYKTLGLEYPLEDIPECSDEDIERIKVYAENMGIKINIGG